MTNNIKDIIQLITTIIAFVTIIWTIYSGLRTYKNNSITKKQEQISNAIKQFSDNNYVNKLSALVPITRNIDIIFDEMFLICGIEKDFIIYKQLEKSLCKVTKRTFSRSLEYNYDFINRLCELKNDCNHDDYRIPWYIIEFFMFSAKELDLECEISRKITNRENEKFDYDLQIKQAMQYIILSSNIISYGIKKYKKNLKLNTNLILYANLYESVIINSKSDKCLYYNSIMRHIKIKKIRLSLCRIIGCNLFDCEIFKSLLTNIIIDNSKLMRATIINTKIDKVKFHNSLHTKSNFKSCIYTAIISNNVNYNGCYYDNCIFEDCKYTYCSFNGAVFKNHKFKAIKFWGNKNASKKEIIEKKLTQNEFIGSLFEDCYFCDVNFVSNLSGASFVKCKLEKINFSGADMKNVKFINCTLQDVDLTKAHETESIKYINTPS